MNRPLEYCCICDDPTGHAGRGDGSLYFDALCDFTAPGVSFVAGQEIGPLCTECKDNLVAAEVVEDC